MVKSIFDIVQTINRSGITILLVEQNVSNALEISNRAYILENGLIISHGTGQDLLKDDHMRKAYLGM
jgi:branched-chain amino acid transport system ATP-binding protein